MLHLDFETRSYVDLKKLGLEAYFADERTSVLCMAWALHDFEVALWIPGWSFPSEVIQHIKNGGTIAAHNAGFERAVFEYGLLPPEVPVPRLEQYLCTATLCRARGLPGELAMAAYALGGEFQKDPKGKSLIKDCCIEPGCSDDRLQELYAYCIADVAAERGLFELLPPPTEEETALYIAAERVNDRGVGIDRQFCIAAGRYRDREMREISEQLAITTDNAVKTAQAKQAAQKWIVARYPDAEELREPKRKSGYSLDKHHLAMFLGRDDLDEDTRYVCELLQDGANTSVSKYDAMLARSADTGRVHGAYVTNAAHTGRFSSKGAQLHNFKRDVPEDWQLKMAAVYNNDLPPGTVMPTLASLLRPTIIAGEGNALCGGDWSGIEARITAWLGDAHEVLAIFADPERDLYQEQASSMGYTDRQLGKVATLACGFGGMGNAFVAMGRNYGLHVSKALGDVYGGAWRNANTWAPNLWTNVERAAVSAMRNPGTPFGVSHGVAFATYGRWLCCQLPSGRVLYYLDPKLEVGKYGGWQLSYRKPQYISPSIPGARARTWGGTLTENIVQAIAADLLRRALITLDFDGVLQVVGHVHDEIIGEVSEARVEDRLGYLHRVMLDAPEWAAGLPLAVDTWHGKRYV